MPHVILHVLRPGLNLFGSSYPALKSTFKLLKDLQRVDKAANGVIRITVYMTKIWQRYTLWRAQEDQLNNKENNPLWTLPVIPLHFTF